LLRPVVIKPGLTWGEGSYARPRIGQVLPAPDQARCEPSRGSQVKPGGALVHSPLETKLGMFVAVDPESSVVLVSL